MPHDLEVLARALLDSAADGIIAADRDGMITLWNPGAERIFGYSADEAVGQSLDLIIPERQRPAHWQGFSEVMRTGQFPLVVPTTVLEALSNAGGFKDFANSKKIIILRNGSERLKFNYNEVIKGKKMEQNILLAPGDHIIVP